MSVSKSNRLEAAFLGHCLVCHYPMYGPCGHCIAEANASGTTYEVKRLKDLVCDREDTIIERDASIARLTTRLAEDDKDATIERLIAQRDAARDKVKRMQYDLILSPDAPRLHIPPPYTPKPVRSGHVPSQPCPDSCGGQSWTGVDTNYGRRWRCDTCGRVISRYVTDAIQGAFDRRAL